MTIQELADMYLNYLETAKKEDGTSYVRCKENAPVNLKVLIQEAHDGMLPDDYKYDFVETALQEIAGYDGDEDCIEDVANELEPDVYNSDLIKWFGSHHSRWEYVNEAVELWGHADDIIEDIKNGQLMEMQEVFYSVLESLRKIIEDFTFEED